MTRTSLIALCVALSVAASQSWAQIAVSSNDRRMVLDNGAAKVVPDPKPNTATIIDMNAWPPKVIAEIDVPGSVVGPPLSVAITPDEGLAFVAAAMKHDPADKTKQVPDTTISIIDLKANPPAVIGTLQAGLAPAGMSITRDGKLLLVANRAEGSVSVFKIDGKTVTAADKVAVGKPESLLSHVAITPDGKLALVSMFNDHVLKLLSIDGDKVTVLPREISTGIRPYPLAIHPNGQMAVVANIGRGTGDVDTLSVIDLTKSPPRTVAWVDLGYETPEGMMLSPDGRWCGVVLHNGTGRAKDSPFFNTTGRLVIYRIEGTKLTKAAEAPIGRWSQGVVFSRNGETVMVQNMVEQNIQVFRFDGQKLSEGEPIKLGGGGAAIRIADK